MNDVVRVRWGRALTTAGWLFVLAYVGFLTSQIRRAFAISEASFEDGIWGQRIEQISFATLPQNLIVLVPAAAAAATATLLVIGIVDRSEIWLTQLVRIVAGLSYVTGLLALIGILEVFFRSPDGLGDVAPVLGRAGGVMMSIAMVRVCLEAERAA